VKNFRPQHRPKKSSLVVGKKAVLSAIAEGRGLDKIYLYTKSIGEEVNAIRKAATQHIIPINYVPMEKLNSFNVEGHDGCVAMLSKVQYHDLQQVISWVVDKGETPLFLILDGITDVRNIGGIARSGHHHPRQRRGRAE
jgi:23S rRNA (guanosine2251-2'-O)-methyltransferase